jgi:hypothetical protein
VSQATERAERWHVKNGGNQASRPISEPGTGSVASGDIGCNPVFMLVGDRQVEDLDEVVSVADNPSVVFVKLVPLAGG